MRRIVGVETEYGLAARKPDGARGVRISGGEAAQRLFTPLERQYASSKRVPAQRGPDVPRRRLASRVRHPRVREP